MWPWGHFAVGYLCFVGYLYIRQKQDNSLVSILAVGFGTQFPDLVDKPLAWTIGALPSGRSLGHSLITAVLIFAVGYWLTSRKKRGRKITVVAFAIGHFSHNFADLGPSVVWGLLTGQFDQLQWTTYLLWPILKAPPYANDESFLHHFAALSFDHYVIAQFVLFGVAIIVWILEGTPGLQTLIEAEYLPT